MDTQSFLLRVEYALLSLEPGTLVPKVPDLTEDVKADFEALRRLAEPARAGCLQELLADSWLQPLAQPLERAQVEASLAAGGLEKLQEDLLAACCAFASSPARALAVQMLGVAFLQHFLRANCTGPAQQEDDPVLPFHPSALAEASTWGPQILAALEVDGEPPYELLACPGYLWLSALLLQLLPEASPLACDPRASLSVWRGRCAFAWQLSLAEASERGSGQCPALFRAAVVDLVGEPGASTSPLAQQGFLDREALVSIQTAAAPLLRTWNRTSPGIPPVIVEEEEEKAEGSDALEAMLGLFDGSSASPPSTLKDAPDDIRACLLVELANRLCWYGRLKVWQQASDAACRAADFDYELTGVLGIKREHQTQEFAQLVVKAKGKENAKGIEIEESDTKAPGTLSLKAVDDMTDVLETPKLSQSVSDKERQEIERPLKAAEQLILLTRCHYIWASSNPNDEMVLQEINALAQRILKKQDLPVEEEAAEGPLFTANWLTFSCGLWFRCRAEHHRNKTRERAAFQLQSLVDQFSDVKPSAAHRLRMAHSCGYPARFHLQHEMASRMMRMGMVSTAHEQFKALRMWPEAVECLIVAERKVEAEDLVKDLIEKNPSPRLWCCLGDILKDPKHYETAWDLSKKRFARAQRSLGRYHFEKKQLAKAVESFKLALDINPMFEGIWFTLGVGLMQLERMEEAMVAFSRVISINDEDGQAWANLAAVHLHQERVKEARTCMMEATKRCRQNWRMWESFQGICIKLRDISGVIQSLRRLVELEQMGRVKRQILGMVTQAVVTDMPDLFEGRSGRTCMRQLLDFYKFATDHTASRPDFWGFYAHLQEAAGDDKAALESRLRQGRALQARLWDENDPETFSEYLQELLECFDLVDQTMDDPRTKDIAKAESPAFSSTVAEAAKKLRDKLELTVQEPQWKPAVGKLAALAQKAERRCASPAASRFQLGARGLMSTNSLVLSEAGDEARLRLDGPAGRGAQCSAFALAGVEGGSRGRPFFMGDPIKVCVRVRPLSASATEDNEIVCVRVPPADSPDKIPNTVMLMHNRSHAKTYNFDRVYWSVKPTDSHYVSQERLMEDLGGELRDNVIGGYHSCLFAYGQTGSGKTYTVLGNDSSPEQRGLLPRIVQEIFENIAELKSPSNEVTVTISYLEIYNEQIRDLLVTSEDTRWKLEVRANPKYGNFVFGLKEVPVMDWPNMKAWLDFGVKARAVASTSMNATSSRSHCIFTMELIQKQWSGGTCNQLRSKLSVVDLAGSERQKKTQATGSRLKEGAMINQSLHNLSLVISRLAEPMKAKEQKRNPDFIPFRQSKLTFLMLEDCLRGNSKTVLIAALSPAGFNFDETMSTLQFAQNAKAVKTNAKKNENLEETLMKELEAECARLRKLVSTDAGQGQQQELEALEAMQRKYGRNLQEQLMKLAEDLQKQREMLLGNAGLTSLEMTKSMGLEGGTPHLLNVCYDPELNGCLIYFLLRGVRYTLGPDASASISLRGLGMLPKMLEIRNIDNCQVTLSYIAGRVLLNGCQVRSEANLYHNDRIMAGQAFCFRLVVPGKGMKRELELETALDEVEMQDDLNYQQCLLLTQNLQNRIGEARSHQFRLGFQKVCRLVSEANALAEDLCPRERLLFSAEILSVPGDNQEASEVTLESVVRLRRLDTGKARWRSFVRDKVLKPRKKPLSLLDHFVKVSMPVRSGQTSLLMNLEEFSQRLQHFRDVFKWRSDGHALEDLRPAERDCWDYTPPWIHREMEQEQLERGTPAQSAQGSRELMLEEELASLRRLLEAKDNRIEALELAMAKDKAGQRERRPSTSLGREAPGVRKDAHGQVMSRVRELIDSGRQRQAAEQQLLERHLQDLATGSSSSLEKLRALRSEVRSEVHFKNTATDEAERLAAQLQSCEEKLEEKLRHGSCSGEYDVEQHLLDSEADAATQLMLAAAQLSGKSKERWELPRRAMPTQCRKRVFRAVALLVVLPHLVTRAFAPWRLHGSRQPRSWRVARYQAAQDDKGEWLSPAEQRRIHRAVEAKALEALAVGNLPPGRELELISALDLQTVPWAQLPIRLKEALGLPLKDRGIDSLALNLSVAVQAKDYSANSGAVPLNRLTNFYFLAKAEGSPLRPHVQHLVVATNESTQLPKRWQWTGAAHRRYSAAEIEAFRGGAGRKLGADTARWPHQLQCLRRCLDFMRNASQRDFFVQMATGTGKSLVMADLLAELGQEQRACVIVPKLDLMEQMARLLEETLHRRKVCRVGTGYEADLTADVFVCVRNSAWRLQNLTLDLLLLDEAHHYEPAALSEEPQPSDSQLAANDVAGVHATQVLKLNARKRIFFSATLIRNLPDFDFGLRPAIEAGVIQDYTVMVPVVSEGDPRPSLVELLRNLPFARKALAFCNTVQEAKHFTRLLSDAGIAADHYNSHTTHARRQDVLNSFTEGEARGGIRVLVTVDVLSEGVDLPVADTCLFVAPRHGVRLRQCVGRVLRKHSSKVDALVLAPPIVRRENNIRMAKPDTELTRLISELAAADASFHASLHTADTQESCRVGVVAARVSSGDQELAEEAAKVLRLHVFPRACRGYLGEDHFETGYQELLAFLGQDGHVTMPRHIVTANNFRLGQWVWRQRQQRRAGKLSQGQIQRLDSLAFVWHLPEHKWQLGFEELVAYTREHGNTQVPAGYKTAGGFGLRRWVNVQRWAKSAGKLSEERAQRLNSLDFVWGKSTVSLTQRWERGFEELVAYTQEHGHAQVPAGYKTAGGFGLGRWVSTQRRAKPAGKLSEERAQRLNSLDFVWGKRTMSFEQRWERGFEELVAYTREHGNTQVPAGYKTAGGFGLRRWVNVQRWAKSAGKLSEERAQRLNSLDFVWGKRTMSFEQRWELGFEELVAYTQEHGNAQVPAGYKTAGGFGLRRWVNVQRWAKSAGKLSEERTQRLNSLGQGEHVIRAEVEAWI
ncbi:unnamed protein product [Effrenium voratum]|uniref:Uncharacterized protein n=1 Tax=Effrenium voratum TaxID=2562239 RepID=A0AA36J7S6_9DINO|nr:unnamed protein product [Effrenium voratum]